MKGFASQVMIIEFQVMLSWFPTLMKKDKIPKRISILNGWMEFDLGALGLCKCLCFVESLVFSCLVDWMVYLGILRLFGNGRRFIEVPILNLFEFLSHLYF